MPPSPLCIRRAHGQNCVNGRLCAACKPCVSVPRLRDVRSVVTVGHPCRPPSAGRPAARHQYRIVDASASLPIPEAHAGMVDLGSVVTVAARVWDLPGHSGHRLRQGHPIGRHDLGSVLPYSKAAVLAPASSRLVGAAVTGDQGRCRAYFSSADMLMATRARATNASFRLISRQ